MGPTTLHGSAYTVDHETITVAQPPSRRFLCSLRVPMGSPGYAPSAAVCGQPAALAALTSGVCLVWRLLWPCSPPSSPVHPACARSSGIY